MIIMNIINSRKFVDVKDVTKEDLKKWLDGGEMICFAKRINDDSAALIRCVTVKYGVVFISKFNVNRKNNIHLIVSTALGFLDRTSNILMELLNGFDLVYVDKVMWEDKEYIIPPYSSREYIIDTKRNDPVQPYKCNTIRSVASYIRRTGDILLYK